jgi:TonB family protein
LLFRICSIAFIFVFASAVTFAQTKTCDLGLKVFSYDAMNSPKNRLINVSVQLKGKGNDLRLDLSNVSNDGFKNLQEGTYRLEFQKAGYKKRLKEVELDCGLVDKQNEVWNYTYLWRDKKFSANDADLVTYENESATSSNAKVTTPSSDNKIFGKVNVKVVIDEDGNVISVSRIDGDKRLADRATVAARLAKFSPTLIQGVPYKVTGSLTYNFVP